MAFVAVATTVGTTVGLTGVGATLAGGAILGAGAGGLYSAITKDGNILDSMLTGGLIGGAVGGIGGAMFPGAAGIAPAGSAAAPAAAAAAPSTAAVPTANVMTTTPAMQAAAANAANLEAAALAEGSTVAGMAPAANTGLAANTVMPTSMTFTPPVNTVADAAGKSLGKQMLGYGLAGTAAMQLLGNKPTVGAGPAPYPGDIRPFEYASRPTGEMGESPYPTARYDIAGNPILDTSERSYFDQGFTAYQPYRAGTANPNIPLPVKTAADGGLMAAYPMNKYIPGSPNVETYTMGLAAGGDVDMESMRQKGIMGMIKGASNKELEQALGAMNKEELLRKVSPEYSQYMAPTVPGIVQAMQPMKMARGGISDLGTYSDGGRMLKGPGDGMSDDIPGVIGGKQPARLADGEFVVPADVVSHLGNGSTDAGAKRLYAMMDRVRKARTGTKKQGKQIKAEKYLPK